MNLYFYLVVINLNVSSHYAPQRDTMAYIVVLGTAGDNFHPVGKNVT